MQDEKEFNTKGVVAAHRYPWPREESLTPACAGHRNPEQFFPQTQEDLAAAASLCGRCEIRGLCLEIALARAESGVWGGVLLDEGRPGAVPRRPGRPRKSAGGQQVATAA